VTVAQLQTDFAAALLDPEAAVPADIRGRAGDTAERRFAVYRNNVAVSLVDALAERFPVCQRLVGEDFFRAMARLYVAGSPPVSPLLMTYGDDFHRFVAGFEPAGEIPYLPDIAYLEAARTRAYHAADAAPLDAGDFAKIAPDRLVGCRAALHPSLELLCSSWAIGTIWMENAKEGEPGEIDADVAEDVIVARPDLDVTVDILSSGGEAAFMIALMEGETLGAAAARAAEASAAFDAQAALAQLIRRRLVTALHPTEGSET
jgi:hypothetical protein